MVAAAKEWRRTAEGALRTREIAGREIPILSLKVVEGAKKARAPMSGKLRPNLYRVWVDLWQLSSDQEAYNEYHNILYVEQPFSGNATEIYGGDYSTAREIAFVNMADALILAWRLPKYCHLNQIPSDRRRTRAK